MILALGLAALVAGSSVYCILVVIAARRYRARPAAPESAIPISILKPLHGLDEGLADNLRSFFRQDYRGEFEVLMAVRGSGDAAWAVAERVRAEFPGVASRLIEVGEPPWDNAKVWSLHHLMRSARHDVMAMADSDTRVDAQFLRTVAGEMGSGLDLITCPYRAVGGDSLWSRLEAVGMNTEFLSGVLVARMLDGMKFAVGPTIVARREAIEKAGGWERLKDYLAEDFVLGKFAAEAGCQVELSRYVIEHRIGTQGFAANARHRLRWCRSTRRSRPAGYVGQVFTNPLPLAAGLVAAAPAWWPMAAFAMAARAVAAWETGWRTVRDPVMARLWPVMVSDLTGFAFWLAGFFGNTIGWRGRQYYLYPDGKFRRLQ